MLIVFKSDATAEQQGAVKERIRESGHQVHVARAAMLEELTHLWHS